jgi:hypothetical protein
MRQPISNIVGDTRCRKWPNGVAWRCMSMRHSFGRNFLALSFAIVRGRVPSPKHPMSGWRSGGPDGLHPWRRSPAPVLAGGRGPVDGPSLDPEFRAPEKSSLSPYRIRDPGFTSSRERGDGTPSSLPGTGRSHRARCHGSIVVRTSPRAGKLSVKPWPDSQNFLLMRAGLRGAPASRAISAVKAANFALAV